VTLIFKKNQCNRWMSDLQKFFSAYSFHTDIIVAGGSCVVFFRTLSLFLVIIPSKNVGKGDRNDGYLYSIELNYYCMLIL
jgi:hypothetical protein